MNDFYVIDAHADTTERLLDKNESLLKNDGHLSLSQMTEYKGYVQFFAAWVKKEEKNPTLRAIRMIENLKKEIAIFSDSISLVTNEEEIQSVIYKGKCGALLSLEDARSLAGSLETLYMFYDMGVRLITLAWNDDNNVIGGSLNQNGLGLTAFGKTLVNEMNQLKMIVDVSHSSEKGFWDVLETSQAPVMASHSNAKAICNHNRNLNNEQIKALIQNDGIVCLNLYPLFLSDTGNASIKTILRHAEHILALGGSDHLGLGSDFDGVDMLTDGICNVKDYVKLFEEMQKHGYSDDLIHKITHKNILNFIRRIEK